MRTIDWPRNVNYEILQRITGKARNTLQQAYHRSDFDPEDLESMLLYLARHAHKDLRYRIIMHAMGEETHAGERGHRKDEGAAKRAEEVKKARERRKRA